MNELPTVSILMPVRNEEQHLEAELRAILEQDYPARLVEVVVVDGCSDDRTVEIATDMRDLFEDRGFRGYTVVTNPDRTTPMALNLGLKQSDGEVIMRVDGHSRIGRDHVRRCVELLAETGADNVGGSIDARGATVTGEAVAIATTSPFGVGGSTFRHGRRPGWVQTVYPGAFRRELFDRVGSFDEELVRNQDDEFNFRIIQAGGRIWYDPRIRTEHYARDSLSAHFKQHFEFGMYKVRVMQKRRAVPAPRHVVPAAFVLTMATSLLLSVVDRRSVYVAAVTGPYLLAATSAAVVGGRDRPVLIPRILAAFVLMHFGYGLGTIAGALRWWRSFTRARA